MHLQEYTTQTHKKYLLFVSARFYVKIIYSKQKQLHSIRFVLFTLAIRSH